MVKYVQAALLIFAEMGTNSAPAMAFAYSSPLQVQSGLGFLLNHGLAVALVHMSPQLL